MSKAYRLKKGTISRPEGDKRVLYTPGDVVQMSDEQLAAFNGVLEPVHTAPSPEAKEAAKKEKPALAADLVEAIANSDDEDELLKILEAEEAGPNRKSVVEAATAKLEELTTEDDEKED